MTSRRQFIGSMIATAAVVPLVSAEADDEADVPALVATGAVIGAVTAAKTTVTFICSVCGHALAPDEISTPAVGVPYTKQWTCPMCQDKQTVTIVAVDS